MTLEEELKIRWHYGYDEGKAAGLEKGAAQKQREIAKVMKEKKYLEYRDIGNHRLGI